MLIHIQAVRNKLDLNVTAMPPKYRQMGDFHEYYSGIRKAPYPTIFIGGNHEASNHLFELYYGGWVAPNIYYLGAANVIRFGPLRIAGLSGIYKPYDYWRSHFERLPYNDKDMYSVFHVRELDARKLLAVKSQVDIGLSHDWPQGIELFGDSKWLFDKRRDFKDDSKNGRLGSMAARQCLDRLRPPYWFSAHLHTRFAAMMQHGEYLTGRQPELPHKKAPFNLTNKAMIKTSQGGNGKTPLKSRLEDQTQVSAWQNFHIEARRADEEERIQILQEQELKKTGKVQPEKPLYNFDETFKKISTDDHLGREITSVSKWEGNNENLPAVLSVDGCGFSSAIPSKGHQDVGNPDEIDIQSSDEESNAKVQNQSLENHNVDTTNSGTPHKASIENLDAIDIPMSSEEEAEIEIGRQGRQETGAMTSTAAVATMAVEQDCPVDLPKPEQLVTDIAQDEQIHPEHKILPPQVDDKDEISEDLRAQLAQISSSFAPVEKVEVSPALPLPAAISNKTTRFLALGKCERYQEFLQLLEINPICASESQSPSRPFKLSYDPEWLAILRVFAPELSLGGRPGDRVPQHRGDTYYHERILEEERWVTEHVVEPGLLDVPENFSVTAPVYDPNLQVDATDMPREFTNPQTVAFCKLVGIENPFDLSEEERDSRINEGARRLEDNPRTDHRKAGGRGGRGGGRGGFKQRGHGGGRGRGRGRGR